MLNKFITNSLNKFAAKGDFPSGAPPIDESLLEAPDDELMDLAEARKDHVRANYLRRRKGLQTLPVEQLIHPTVMEHMMHDNLLRNKEMGQIKNQLDMG
jgi:hypothetical protein